MTDKDFNDYLDGVKDSIRLVDTYEVPYSVRIDILTDIMIKFHKDVVNYRKSLRV